MSHFGFVVIAALSFLLFIFSANILEGRVRHVLRSSSRVTRIIRTFQIRGKATENASGYQTLQVESVHCFQVLVKRSCL